MLFFVILQTDKYKNYEIYTFKFKIIKSCTVA